MFSPTPTVVLMEIYPLTYICSPEKPTNEPLKGCKCFGSSCSHLKASLYRTLFEHLWSWYICFTSHFNIYTVMIMGHFHVSRSQQSPCVRNWSQLQGLSNALRENLWRVWPSEHVCCVKKSTRFLRRNLQRWCWEYVEWVFPFPFLLVPFSSRLGTSMTITPRRLCSISRAICVLICPSWMRHFITFQSFLQLSMWWL